MTTANIKKVCFLLPSHFSAKMGGAEYQIKLIIDALQKNGGYDIYYLCRNIASSYVPNGYNTRKVGTAKGLGRYGFVYDFWSLYRELKRLKPHIIYQRVGCAYTGIAALYARRHGVKMIWHIAHDTDVMPPKTFPLKKRIIRYPDLKLREYGIRNADVIIGQTEDQNQLLLKNYGRKCDVIIPNGHPIPEDKIDKTEKITVMWISNFKPFKQPEVFIRIAKCLNNVCNVSFVMIGRSGPEKLFRQLLVEIKDVPNLEYLGEISNDEVNRRLSEGHILVNTSLYEGFSNTFIQAWLRRVPVVSLNVDPDDILVCERIGFHSGTFDALCRDVIRLVENKALREEMGSRARRYACDNHAIDKMVERIFELI